MDADEKIEVVSAVDSTGIFRIPKTFWQMGAWIEHDELAVVFSFIFF